MKNSSKEFTTDNNYYNSCLSLFLTDIEFAITYISVNYPFDYEFIIDNWDVLKQGIAHYCVFLESTGTIYFSKFGLCYNKNIRWNSKLKAKYDYGFVNPYEGFVEGIGNGGYVEFSERDYLDTIIPLDIRTEIEFSNRAIILHWHSTVGHDFASGDESNFGCPNILDIDAIFEPIPHIGFEEVENIFTNQRIKLLLNEDIWKNTLCNIIDNDFCSAIIKRIKVKDTELDNLTVSGNILDDFKVIKNIKTVVRNKKQVVVIGFDANDFVFMSPSNIIQRTGLSVAELELLIGSSMRVDFYNNGDLMFNGQRCEQDETLVNQYVFQLQKPVDRLRIDNKNQLLNFKKIKDIFYFNKFGADNVGIKMEDDSVVFLSLKRFEVLSKFVKSEQHVLIGSHILPEYYGKGSKLPDGTTVSQVNRVLQGLNIRYSNKVGKVNEHFENVAKYSDDEEHQDDSVAGPGDYGYSSWEEMTLNEAFEGDSDNYWNVD